LLTPRSNDGGASDVFETEQGKAKISFRPKKKSSSTAWHRFGGGHPYAPALVEGKFQQVVQQG
jgi:hypothetical protein